MLYFSDPMMGTLDLVNLLAVMMLFPVGLRVSADYREQLKQGVEHPAFDPQRLSDLDIDPTAWRD